MTPPAYSAAEDSVRLLLTKNPARSFSYPWCQVHGILFGGNGSRGPGRELARYRLPPIVLIPA